MVASFGTEEAIDAGCVPLPVSLQEKQQSLDNGMLQVNIVRRRICRNIAPRCRNGEDFL